MALFLVLAIILQGAPIKVTTVARSTMSQIDSARQAVARTPADWAALWKEHAGNAPAPKVDLNNATVVAVFLGQRMTAGYAVEITDARMSGSALVVRWGERRPGADQMTAQVLTSPMHIASIPAFAGEIRFEKVDK
ncbi:MAG: protease complex subunit PrcB family protein [Vicinamibacterales bacterium]